MLSHRVNPASAQFAQSPTNMTDGEIRKIDKEAKTITIKHGEIKNIDMPGMTMVFQVVGFALLHHAVGNVNGALKLLRECVTKAQSQGPIRLFVDEDGPMQTLLLSELPHDAQTAPYVSQLLAAFGPQATPEKYATVPTAATSAHLPLGDFSQRELEILRLIRDGHSNQNIGERLFLSLSTVKWHNQNIFSKLDVQRRTEAVARAVQLKLL